MDKFKMWVSSNPIMAVVASMALAATLMWALPKYMGKKKIGGRY